MAGMSHVWKSHVVELNLGKEQPSWHYMTRSLYWQPRRFFREVHLGLSRYFLYIFFPNQKCILVTLHSSWTLPPPPPGTSWCSSQCPWQSWWPNHDAFHVDIIGFDVSHFIMKSQCVPLVSQYVQLVSHCIPLVSQYVPVCPIGVPVCPIGVPLRPIGVPVCPIGVPFCPIGPRGDVLTVFFI